MNILLIIVNDTYFVCVLCIHSSYSLYSMTLTCFIIHLYYLNLLININSVIQIYHEMYHQLFRYQVLNPCS